MKYVILTLVWAAPLALIGLFGQVGFKIFG